MNKNKPFIIGISGNSGSGKSTFEKVLLHLLGEKNVLVIFKHPLIALRDDKAETPIGYNFIHRGK